MGKFADFFENVRQGENFDAFEKQRELESIQEARGAATALDQSRFDRAGEQLALGNARADRGETRADAAESRSAAAEARRVARGPERTFQETYELDESRRAEDILDRTQKAELAGQDRAATAAHRTAVNEFNQGQQEANAQFRTDKLSQQRITGIAAILQRNIDDLQHDEDAQANASRLLEEFLADPEGTLDKLKADQSATQGAAPEGPGAFGKLSQGIYQGLLDLTGGV